MKKETGDYIAFGDRLAYARKKKGLPQKHLAELIGVTQSIVSRWEKGKHKPDLSTIRKIIKALEVSEDWLIGNDSFRGNRQIRLTKAQRKLVADNEYIIGDAIRKFCTGNRGYDYEKLYGDAAIGLCKAAQSYKKDRGPFYQIAYLFVKWAICSAFRKDYTRLHLLDALSLDQPFSDDNLSTLGELIPAPDDEWEQLEYNILVESVYQKVEPVLTVREKEAFRPWLRGECIGDISKKIGAKPATVSWRIKEAKKKCQASFNADEMFS